MTLVDDPLLRQASLRPDAPAVADATHAWTFGELEAATRRVAVGLAVAGVREGDSVATLLADDAAAVALVHAVRWLGAVLVPLNRRLTAVEFGRLVRDSGASLLVHDAAHTGRAGEVVALTPGARALDLADLLAGAPGSGRGALRERVDPAAPATIVFTSGTTGRPKGAVLTHGQHAASVDAWAGFLEPRPTDRWLACVPLHHVAGLSIVGRSVAWGTPLLIHRRFDPALVDAAIEAGVSHLSLVATMLDRLLEVRRLPAPATLRAVLVGGGPTPPGLLRAAIERGLPVVPTYGLTETASGVTALSPDETAGCPGSAGRALPGAELRIAHGERIAEPREAGEILVRGPMVLAGYRGDPAATAAALRDGWLHTGDLGWLDADGRLTVLDRRVDLIISGGENVYPAEVEAVLRDHPAVADAAVVGRPDARWGAVPVAAIVVRSEDAVTDDALVDHCRARLAGYKVPVAVHRLDALPRTASGKLLRREVRAMVVGRDPG